MSTETKPASNTDTAVYGKWYEQRGERHFLSTG